MDRSKEEVKKLQNLAKKAEQLVTVLEKERRQLNISARRCIAMRMATYGFKRQSEELSQRTDYTDHSFITTFDELEYTMEMFFEEVEFHFEKKTNLEELIKIYCPDLSVTPY